MEFDKTLRFWYPRVTCNAWINVSSYSDENRLLDFRRSYREVKNIFPFLSLSSPHSHSLLPICLPKMWPFLFDFPFSFPYLLFLFFLIPFLFLFIFIFYFFYLDTWLTLPQVSITHSGPFMSRNNLFIFNSIYFN